MYAGIQGYTFVGNIWLALMGQSKQNNNGGKATHYYKVERFSFAEKFFGLHWQYYEWVCSWRSDTSIIIYWVSRTYIIWGAYYKPLRYHFIIDDALCVYIPENSFTSEDVAQMKACIKTYKEKLGSEYSNETIECFGRKINEKFKELSDFWRTQKLWLMYHNMVSLIKIYIRAVIFWIIIDNW